jgi:hypothetical protein
MNAIEREDVSTTINMIGRAEYDALAGDYLTSVQVLLSEIQHPTVQKFADLKEYLYCRLCLCCCMQYGVTHGLQYKTEMTSDLGQYIILCLELQTTSITDTMILDTWSKTMLGRIRNRWVYCVIV